MLASASPRRKQLLEQVGWLVLTHAVDIDETPIKGEDPAQYCVRMAEEKALAAATQINTHLPVITADTTVVFNDQILGKPQDQQQAFEMLNMLSGEKHLVFSAVTISHQQLRHTRLNRNEVEFTNLSEQDIWAYIATGEPMDKAGAYGIQGFAGMWVTAIKGSYSGIMGLPLFETTQLLNKLDIMSPLDVLKTS